MAPCTRIVNTYEMNQTRSHTLFEKALRYIPGGVNSPVRAFRNVGMQPFFVDRAEGPYVWDVDGNRLIDYVCTWGPSILGHAAPPVIEAVIEAAKKGTSFGIPNPAEVELAALICEWVPSIEKVRMVSSGTEATMSAIRLARGFTGRDLILKFEGCYHGHVDSLLIQAGSGALTHGRPDSAGVPAALAALTRVLPFNDLPALEALFTSQGDQLAAVILEPVPANAGLYLPRPGYLQTLRDLCTKHGVVLIFDEVMTGFRLAKGGYQEICGIAPDLTALGKVIGGGLPVGAFGGRAEIMNQLSPDGPVYQAGTLSGNPLAMAAGLAQLRTLESENGYEKLENLGAQLESGVRSTLQKIGRPFTFQRIGSMFCLYFTEREVWNLNDAKTSDTALFARFFKTCLESGLYLAPSQYEAGFLSLAHTPEILERSSEIFLNALR